MPSSCVLVRAPRWIVRCAGGAQRARATATASRRRSWRRAGCAARMASSWRCSTGRPDSLMTFETIQQFVTFSSTVSQSYMYGLLHTEPYVDVSTLVATWVAIMISPVWVLTVGVGNCPSQLTCYSTILHWCMWQQLSQPPHTPCGRGVTCKITCKSASRVLTDSRPSS